MFDSGTGTVPGDNFIRYYARSRVTGNELMLVDNAPKSPTMCIQRAIGAHAFSLHDPLSLLFWHPTRVLLASSLNH